MKDPMLLVTMPADDRIRAVIARTVGGSARIVHLSDVPAGGRRAALDEATVVLARNTRDELAPDELPLIFGARLLQFVTAGVDHIPLSGFPDSLPIACNGGGYAEPMAEHAVAMTFAAAKRLVVEHKKLERGEFDQFRPNRMLAGATCGILGFGGIGVATARLMRALGLKVHAVNRSGRTAEPVDWIGSTGDLAQLLAAADVLVLSLPLTRATAGLIGARELSRMKPDAILVNLARGEIVDEAALYAHLVANAAFTACIDAWWVEPVRHGCFRMDHPFMTLPNVVASPHNSASVKGWRETAIARAVANAVRVFKGEAPRHLVAASDRMN
jgi:phosphoglycerate dehydrogenase-like enzyme